MDTTTLDSIIPDSFQKYRRSNGLRLFGILALTAVRASRDPATFFRVDQPFPSSGNRRIGERERRCGHDADQYLYFPAAKAQCGVAL